MRWTKMPVNRHLQLPIITVYHATTVDSSQQQLRCTILVQTKTKITSLEAPDRNGILDII